MGTVLAVAGHVVAGGPLLCAVYTFTRYAEPDSVFMVCCLTAVLELALGVICVAFGLIVRSSSPSLATGVLSGWLGGLLVIPCGGTMLVGFLAGLT
ncbi:hypothetical protein [Actinoplanes sp. HUAS TT8]|uniref:hypothetical protein n=1 Tax=Actinoplanes sp. HUAS TT8 TaxID=3447453 RepID=UPI003F523635